MNTKTFAVAFLAAALTGWTSLRAQALSQTASELLQKGIYTQETVGDLDGAIQIYRQIVATSAGKDVGAQAQYRLAQSLLQKGDLVNAAQEFNKLSQEYSNYRDLVSKMARSAQVPSAPLAPVPLSGEFDSSRPINVSGAVTQVLWMNPRAWMHIKDASGTDWGIVLVSPNQLLHNGWTRNTLKLGEQLSVTAFLAKDGTKNASAQMIVADGKTLFDRATLLEAPAPAVVNLYATPAATPPALASITGMVTGPDGAVTNASVEARNIDNGAVFNTTSTEKGNYFFTQLPLGKYEITITIPGETKHTRLTPPLTAGMTLRIDDSFEVHSDKTR